MTSPPDFRHLIALSDEHGTFEHARYLEPRREHGYCADDVARVLVVTAREPDPAPEVRRLAAGSLWFLIDAQDEIGRTRNRRSVGGRWHGRHTVEDCWGRSLWAFGTAVEHTTGAMAATALVHFERGAQRRSPFPRSMAHAALGAAAVLQAQPGNPTALALLADAVEVDVLGRPADDAAWPWPEPRLAYADAVLPDALLAAGSALDRPELVGAALALLGWLLDRQTVDGHLSVTPVGGAGPGDRHGFDQQPIEVAMLAEACARASTLTGDPRWTAGVRMAGAWFDGDNDTGAVMWDERTGGGYDGLQVDGPNLNQGAESTIALLATRQLVRVVDRVTA
jgi:hypothetical protein